MSLLNHQELSIVKGVGPTPGDTTSAEQPLVVVDFLTSDSAFALVDWTPNIPSLKNGGVWTDSPISDGRTLIAGVNTNVTETIVVQLTGTSIVDFASQFAKLQQMIQDARDFWDSFYQIEPVYMRWWANNAPGPQFALIYNIDMDLDWNDSNVAQAQLTLTIEREFGWRGIAPGHNPKEWTYLAARSIFKQSVASLFTGNYIASGTVRNCLEWSTISVPSAVNYLDIPSTSIPGDLPALLMVLHEQGGTAAHNTVYVGRNSKPTSLVNSSGGNALEFLDLTASASTLSTDTTLANDTGATLYTPASVNRRRAEVSFATLATNFQRVIWGNAVANPNFSINTIRGRYHVFIRARQSNGTAGDIKVSIQVAYSGVTVFTSEEQNPTVASGAGNTVAWPIIDIGVIDFPALSKALGNFAGTGLHVVSPSAGTDVAISLFSRRTAGVGVLYVCDLILIPIDEPCVKMTTDSAMYTAIYDNTGYFTHGDILDGAYRRPTPTGNIDMPSTIELSGNQLTLIPQRNNRLYFFMTDINTQSRTQNDATVGVQIVPRWSGIRNV